MTLTQEQLNQLYESTVVSDDGQTLGRVGHIYLDDHTQQPAWVTFKSGLFGTKETFAPLLGARFSDSMIRVRFTKDYISDAPDITSDGHISDEEQTELYRYYRLDELGRQVGAEPVPQTSQPPDLMVGDQMDDSDTTPPPQPGPAHQESVTPEPETVPGQPEADPPSQPVPAPSQGRPAAPEQAHMSPHVPAPSTQTGDIADVDADVPEEAVAAPPQPPEQVGTPAEEPTSEGGKAAGDDAEEDHVSSEEPAGKDDHLAEEPAADEAATFQESTETEVGSATVKDAPEEDRPPA